MLNQLGNECQSQSMEYIEQNSRVLVQLIGDFKEPRTTLSGGEVPGVPQVQPSSSRVDIHNDNLIGAKGDPQAGNTSWESNESVQIRAPVSGTHLPDPVEPPRRRGLDFV